MFKKLAKLKYLPNNYEVIEHGDHVVCAVSGKEISLENLHIGMSINRKPIFLIRKHHKNINKLILFPTIVCPYPLTGIT